MWGTAVSISIWSIYFQYNHELSSNNVEISEQEEHLDIGLKCGEWINLTVMQTIPSPHHSSHPCRINGLSSCSAPTRLNAAWRPAVVMASYLRLTIWPNVLQHCCPDSVPMTGLKQLGGSCHTLFYTHPAANLWTQTWAIVLPNLIFAWLWA